MAGAEDPGPGRGRGAARFSSSGWRGPQYCRAFAQPGPPLPAPRGVRNACSFQMPRAPGRSSTLLALGGHVGFGPVDHGWNSPNPDGLPAQGWAESRGSPTPTKGFPSRALWGTLRPSSTPFLLLTHSLFSPIKFLYFSCPKHVDKSIPRFALLFVSSYKERPPQPEMQRTEQCSRGHVSRCGDGGPAPPGPHSSPAPGPRGSATIVSRASMPNSQGFGEANTYADARGQ